MKDIVILPPSHSGSCSLALFRQRRLPLSFPTRILVSGCSEMWKVNDRGWPVGKSLRSYILTKTHLENSKGTFILISTWCHCTDGFPCSYQCLNLGVYTSFIYVNLAVYLKGPVSRKRQRALWAALSLACCSVCFFPPFSGDDSSCLHTVFKEQTALMMWPCLDASVLKAFTRLGQEKGKRSYALEARWELSHSHLQRSLHR